MWIGTWIGIGYRCLGLRVLLVLNASRETGDVDIVGEVQADTAGW